MTSPTYVPVRLASGPRVEVRVVSLHQDDDVLSEQLFLAEKRMDYCEAQLRKLLDSSREDAAKLIPVQAQIERERNAAFRQLFNLLVDKPSAEDREALLRQASTADGVTLVYAAKGDSPRLNAALRILDLNWDDPDHQQTMMEIARRWLEPEFKQSLRRLISEPAASAMPKPA